MTPEQRIAGFAERLRQTIGAEWVLAGAAAEARYRRDTTPVARRIPLAVRPANREQVVAVVLAARAFGIPLYPISTGNNWGYGGANPVIDGCVVVDLSRMTALSVDPDTGILSAEPGVTQQGLADYLDRHGLNYLCPTTGAGPECSVVGNALERGYGITPHADHFAAVTAIEAVLADGRIYRSPLAELGAASVDAAFKWKIGPYLDGLFAQGNIGIVTRMQIALAPRPERVEAFFFAIEDDRGLEAAVAAVRRILAKLGTVGGSINLMNARRSLSMVVPYPAHPLGPHGIIPDRLLQRLAGESQIMPWMGAGALYGDRRLVAAARRIVREELRGSARRLLFCTGPALARFDRLAGLIPGRLGANLRRVFATLGKTMRLLNGRPSTVALPLAYWRSGGLPADRTPNPAADGCGLMWYAPLVPAQPDRVRGYVDLVERICRRHGLEPLITLTSLSDRCFDSTVPLLFDRADPAAAAAARHCFDELFAAGVAEGFVPYRAHVSTMEKFIGDATAPYWSAVAAIKRGLDPEQLIAPGRYAPHGPHSGSEQPAAAAEPGAAVRPPD